MGGVGEQVKFYPYKKWGRNSFSHAEGSGKILEVVLTWELDVLAIPIESGGGGCKTFPPLTGGGEGCEKFSTVLMGGGGEGRKIFLFCIPSPL